MRTGDGLRIGVAGVCATIALGLPSIAAAGETLAQDFTVSGEHEFVVPAGIDSLRATLIGGDGAAGHGGFPGGTGATVTATLAVTPGETLYVEVAGDGTDLPSGFGSPGGYGGGGAGGDRHSFGTFIGGGGGGGASDLRTCSVGSCAVASRLLRGWWWPRAAVVVATRDTRKPAPPRAGSGAAPNSPAPQARRAPPARRA